ncbi:MAG TPA: hypothetical protein PK156_46105 [Polyangium sp.]|nr:hypothetical protein [Polyangium sp.]
MTPLEFVRTPAQRAFRLTLIVAFLLHLPFVPTRLFAWMSILWNTGPTEIDDKDDELIIPIDFDIVSEPTNPAPAPTAETTAAVEDDAIPEPAAVVTATKKTPPAPILDAGVDAAPEPLDAASDLLDAGVADAAEAADAEAGVEDGGPGDAAIDSSTNDPDASADDAGQPIAQAGTDGGSGGILPASTDAGLPIEKGTNLPDAGPVDAGGTAPTDAGASDGGALVRDPQTIAGANDTMVGKNPHITLLIAGDRLRKFKHGARFGRVLGMIPQWQTFLGDSNLNPVLDIDHMFIAGPRLNIDSRNITVTMDLKGASDAKIRKTIDGIVKRSNPPGAWLKNEPVEAATAYAAGGERLFAIVPGKHIVMVLPAKAKDKLADVKKVKAFPKSGTVGIALSLDTPHTAFGKLANIPDTLRGLHLTLTPTDDGGADVQLEVKDKDATLAQLHAAQITAILDEVRFKDLLLARVEIMHHVDFKADGNIIRAQTHVTEGELGNILLGAEVFLAAQAKPAADAGPRK